MDYFRSELYTHSDIVLVVELSFDVSVDQTWFSDTFFIIWIPWAPKTIILKFMSFCIKKAISTYSYFINMQKSFNTNKYKKMTS